MSRDNNAPPDQLWRQSKSSSSSSRMTLQAQNQEEALGKLSYPLPSSAIGLLLSGKWQQILCKGGIHSLNLFIPLSPSSFSRPSFTRSLTPPSPPPPSPSWDSSLHPPSFLFHLALLSPHPSFPPSPSFPPLPLPSLCNTISALWAGSDFWGHALCHIMQAFIIISCGHKGASALYQHCRKQVCRLLKCLKLHYLESLRPLHGLWIFAMQSFCCWCCSTMNTV